VLVPRGDVPVTVSATEGRTYRHEQVGISTGLAFQRMILPRIAVLLDTVRVFSSIGDTTVEWTRVMRLEDASDEDRAFVLERQSDGSTVVTFGDGINGEIPALHSTVTASYRVGGGVADVPAYTITSLVDPIMPTLKVTNQSPSSGGRNAESPNSIRVNASRAFRARDRAVTLYDFMAMTKTYPGIAKAKAVANNGVSTIVYVTAMNDGSNKPTLTLTEEGALRAYLHSMAMAGVDITVVDTQWVPFYVSLDIHLLPTSRRSEVEAEVRRVMAALFSFDSLDFDQRITVGDINSALFGIKGLSYAVVTTLDTQPDSGSLGPLFFDQISSYAMPYWSDGNLHLTTQGGIV